MYVYLAKTSTCTIYFKCKHKLDFSKRKLLLNMGSPVLTIKLFGSSTFRQKMLGRLIQTTNWVHCKHVIYWDSENDVENV